MAVNITISWTNPAAGAGGTPDTYEVYRANGSRTPEYNSGNNDLDSNWTKLTGSGFPVTHTSFGASSSVVDPTAEGGTTYSYAVLAKNTAGYGLPSSASDVPHQSVTA